MQIALIPCLVLSLLSPFLGNQPNTFVLLALCFLCTSLLRGMSVTPVQQLWVSAPFATLQFLTSAFSDHNPTQAESVFKDVSLHTRQWPQKV